MTKKPVFSVLVPVYNVQEFLPACIDSVLSQTFDDWEIILVNDGSTDNGGNICDKYASQYPDKIKVFHNTNHGLIYSRRFGIAKATGEYCIFLDSDDSLYPNTLQTIYNKFKEYNCDFIIYGFEKVLPNGKQLFATEDNEICFIDKRALCRCTLFSSVYNALWRKAVKRNLLTNEDYSKYYNVELAEDLLQSVEIYRNCRKAVLIPDILYRYRYNVSSITNTVIKKKVSISFIVEEKVLDFLKETNIFAKQDMQDYHDYCVSSFQQQIKQACSHPGPYKDKIKLFKEVKKHPYCKKFLLSKEYKQPFMPFYFQFRLGLFTLLITEGRLYSYLKRKIFSKFKKYKGYVPASKGN